MELMEALKTVLELAEQNMLNTSDPELQEEMQKQLNAIESVKALMQEMETPNPLQVVLVVKKGVIRESFSNVPTEVTVLNGNIEGVPEDYRQCVQAVDGDEYCTGFLYTDTNPTLVEGILKEVFA